MHIRRCILLRLTVSDRAIDFFFSSLLRYATQPRGVASTDFVRFRGIEVNGESTTGLIFQNATDFCYKLYMYTQTHIQTRMEIINKSNYFRCVGKLQRAASAASW